MSLEYPKKEARRFETQQHNYRIPQRISTPTSSSARAPTYATPEEKQHVEALKVQPVEDKMHDVKTFRRAKGLCYKCGMKWAPNHKCAPTVAIHVVEELWQLLQDAEGNHQPTIENDSDSEDDLMYLSVHAMNGTEAPKTMRVMGNLYGHKPLILFDSGSSSNFISESIAIYFEGWTCLTKPVVVKVSNGSSLMCTHQLSNCEVYIQGIAFFWT